MSFTAKDFLLEVCSEVKIHDSCCGSVLGRGGFQLARVSFLFREGIFGHQT